MQPTLFMLNIIFMFIISSWLSIILVSVGDWAYKRNRYAVRIIQENKRTKTKWLKPDKTGKAFNIYKGGMGRGDLGFQPTFTQDSVLYSGWVFKRPYVMVNPFAKDCINFRTEKVPSFSEDVLKKAVSEKLLEAQAKVKGQTSGFMYFLAFLLVIVALMQFLQLNALGVIRLR